MQDQTKIILTRKSEWLNRRRTFKVFIDDVKTGEIRNDNAEEFLVQPGTHTLRCKVDWCGSNTTTVDLKPGEIAYLKVRSGLKYYYIFVAFMFVGLLSTSFFPKGTEKPLWALYIRVAFIIPAILYLGYFLTAGRNKYLMVEDDKDNFFA